VGDYDNDGRDDLFVSYYGQNILYKNHGDGTFTDMTAKAGLAQSRMRWIRAVRSLTMTRMVISISLSRLYRLRYQDGSVA